MTYLWASMQPCTWKEYKSLAFNRLREQMQQKYKITETRKGILEIVFKRFFDSAIWCWNRELAAKWRSEGVLGQYCKTFSPSNLTMDWGAAIPQWIRLRPPFCYPKFESQAHHLCFYNLKSNLFYICHVKRTKINTRRPGSFLWRLSMQLFVSRMFIVPKLIRSIQNILISNLKNSNYRLTTLHKKYSQWLFNPN